MNPNEIEDKSKCNQQTTRPISSYDNLIDTTILTETTINSINPLLDSFNNKNLTNNNDSRSMTTNMNGSKELQNSMIPPLTIPQNQTASSLANMKKICNSNGINDVNSIIDVNVSNTMTSLRPSSSVQSRLASSSLSTTPSPSPSSTITTTTTATLTSPEANNSSINSKNAVTFRNTYNKPVISDAKSKFFGFNSTNNNNSNYNSPKSCSEQTIPTTTKNCFNSSDTSDGVNSNNRLTKDIQNSEDITSINDKSLLEINNKSIKIIPKQKNNNNNCKNYNNKKLIYPTENCVSNEDNNFNIYNNHQSQEFKNCENNEKKYSNFNEKNQKEQQKNLSQSINIKTGNNFNNATSSYEMDTTNNPSQLVYMSTTVPQNIKGCDIAGRHTPTRNSLRHSRMLVVNKNFQGPKTYNPLGLRYPYLTKLLLVHHIVFGVLLTCIGFWILLWAPNTRLQDNPYWSGITLTLAGILGLFLIRFKRMKRHKIRENCFVFLKYDSYLLTLVASTLCFIALVCAAMHLHLLSLNTTQCKSANILIANAACTCMFGVTESDLNGKNNSTHNAIDNVREIDELYYRDLNCSEVFGAWKFILTVSVLLNALGFCVTIFYIISVFWRKKSKNIYSSVRTNSL